MTGDIVDRARRGDPLAWRALYDELAPRLAGYFRARRVHDPEDLVGEVFLGVARGIGEFEGDGAGLRAWVFKIAHSRYVDSVRAADRRPSDLVSQVPEQASESDVEGEVVAQLRREALLELVDALPEGQRTVMLLRTLGDLSMVEIAEATGKTPVAVRVSYHRAMRALERALHAGQSPVLVEVPASVYTEGG